MIKRYTCVCYAYIGNILLTSNNYCCWFLGLFVVPFSRSHLDSFDLRLELGEGKGANLAWYKYILSIHIANNSIRCLNVDVAMFGRLEMNKRQRYFCSLFKVPLCMNIIVAIMRCCCCCRCRTLTEPIDSTHTTLTHKKTEKNYIQIKNIRYHLA